MLSRVRLGRTVKFNSTENYGRRCLTPLSPYDYDLTVINEHYHFITSDWFPVPVRLAVKSNVTLGAAETYLVMI